MEKEYTFGSIVVRTIIVHTLTYMLMGIIFAFVVFDYRRLFSETGLRFLMKPVNDVMVMAGPLFQPVRGMIFGLVFFLLRGPLFGTRRGWLVMWCILAGIGIINTFGPAPGSIEGMIYTVLPLRIHLTGLPEVLAQSFLLSVVLHYWVNHPGKKWLDWTLSILFILTIASPILGLLVGRPS
jgi:hypothetical protein